ncbi:MAG: hypothetical protein WAU21_02135 [Chitinophagales bacterium]|nr:hypothetical protein [Bacteroidota bacterium]MBK8682564.1 hypothetical protein [Bacteroidota bacterium]
MLPSQIQIKKHKEYSGHTAAIYRLIEGYNTNTFISAGGDGLVAVWNLSEDNVGNAIAKTTSSIFSVCKLPGTSLIAVGQLTGALQIIDTETHSIIIDITQSPHIIFDITVNENYLFASSGKGNVFVFDISNFQLIHTILLSEKSIRCLHIINENMYAGASDNYLYKISLHDFSFEKIETPHTNSIFSLTYIPNTQQLISGSRDAQLGIINLNDETHSMRLIPAHLNTINHIAYCAGNGIIATASRDKTIRLWNAEDFTLLKVIDTKYEAHKNSVNNVFWTADSKFLISCGDDRRIIQWQILIDNK